MFNNEDTSKNADTIEHVFRAFIDCGLSDYEDGQAELAVGEFHFFNISTTDMMTNALNTAFGDDVGVTYTPEPGFYLAVLDSNGHVTVAQGTEEFITKWYDNLERQYDDLSMDSETYADVFPEDAPTDHNYNNSLLSYSS